MFLRLKFEGLRIRGGRFLSALEANRTFWHKRDNKSVCCWRALAQFRDNIRDKG